MGHDHRYSLKDYWSREEQYCAPFYSNIMAHDRFFHILRFLHFEHNDNPPNHDDPDYDRLWKLRKIFDILNNKFCELYSPKEQLAVDEVIVMYKERVVFRQYIPKKHKRFGIKIYKLCDYLSLYLGKQNMLCQITFESIIKFCGYDLLLIPNTSSMNVEFYSLSNCFYFIILLYIEQDIYVLWRSAISRFKCPKNSGHQGTMAF